MEFRNRLYVYREIVDLIYEYEINRPVHVSYQARSD